MTIPQISIFDALTGEIITRDMNSAELAQFEADKKTNETKQKQAETEALTKATARQAVLTKLGLTQDEANALLS